MTNKYILILIILIITSFLLVSCGEGISSRLTSTEIEAYEDFVLSSYFMLRGDASIESRAAWDYTQIVALPTIVGASVTATSRDYPEKGQSTKVTIEKMATADVYKVTNVTTYPNRDAIVSTTESYYLLDDGDGNYNTADSICTSVGTINPLARIEFETLFSDGTMREEVIQAVGGTSGTVHYAAFDIDGPLVFPVAEDSSTWGGGTLSGDVWTPGGVSDTSVWSSMVSYDQSLNYDFWLWTYSTHIIGVRYYTEDGGTYTSVTYERTIATVTENEDVGAFADWTQKLFNGRNKDAQNTAVGTTYTETVIRTKIEGTKKKTINTQSVVYDDAGQTFVTFTAGYATDADGVVINSGEPVTVY